ncbi:MAG: ATP-binding protein, partial [Alteraurantiacibacter sp.]
INIDIQRSKDLEEDLKEARRKAIHQARAKSQFLASMSHEIRTPMNGVVGFTELLLKSDLDEEQRAQAQLIADSGRAMMQLLNDVLDHAKIESGQMQLQPEPTDLRHKLQHAVKLMEPMARAKGLSLGVWVDDTVPQQVEMDRLRMRQVLLNLVGNAIKFTQNGGIDVEARVENSTDGRTLLISVIDTGIGIHDSKLDAIFSPFKQEDGSTARKFGGTGLGLAISSQLVGMMGGRITVHSKQGVGTQFTIRLPLKAAAAPGEPLAGERLAGEQSTSCLAGKRVLIAEDHTINQELIMAMAVSLELDAVLTANGDEAVRAVRDAEHAGKPFAVVLMDMQMPEVDGLAATRRLREQGYDAATLPIIALTANCYPEDVAACKEAGMQSHLGKPVTTVALARELARWLSDDGGTSAPVAEIAPARSAGLEDRYRSRKQELVEQLRHSLERAPAQTDWSELARQLHKMAGVAANFGEPELGEASRRLEHQFVTIGEPEAAQRALAREMPLFEKAA